MKSLYLNDDGDLVLDGIKKLKMIDEVEEIAQRLKLSLQTNMGEWFLNKNFGMPWFEKLSENAPKEDFRSDILQIILSDPAIDEVNELNFNIDREEREMKIEFVAIVDDEELKQEVVI